MKEIISLLTSEIELMSDECQRGVSFCHKVALAKAVTAVYKGKKHAGPDVISVRRVK